MNDSNPMFSRLITRPLLILYSLIVLYPILWTALASFKSNEEFYKNPWALPGKFDWTNYVTAFEKASLGSYFINSSIVTVLALLLCNSLGVASAYALIRFPFPLFKWVRRIYSYALFIPVSLIVVPLFMLMNQIGLLDNRFGLVIVYAATAIPFTVYLMTGFLASISKEYEEAAMMDGCSNFGILAKIIAPMSLPGIVTITIFNFMAFWNEYVLALSFISTESKRTLTLGLAYLLEVQRYATDWGALFAGLVMAMIPTLILYALLQRRITTGLNMGGLKG